MYRDRESRRAQRVENAVHRSRKLPRTRRSKAAPYTQIESPTKFAGSAACELSVAVVVYVCVVGKENATCSKTSEGSPVLSSARLVRDNS